MQLPTIKTEFLSFLMVFGAIIANKQLELGLELDTIIVLCSLSTGYTFARTADKMRSKPNLK